MYIYIYIYLYIHIFTYRHKIQIDIDRDLDLDLEKDISSCYHEFTILGNPIFHNLSIQARQATGHESLDAYDEDDPEDDSGTEDDVEIVGQDIPDGSENQPATNPPAPAKTEQAPVIPPSAAAPAVTPSSSGGPEGRGLHVCAWLGFRISIYLFSININIYIYAKEVCIHNCVYIYIYTHIFQKIRTCSTQGLTHPV